MRLRTVLVTGAAIAIAAALAGVALADTEYPSVDVGASIAASATTAKVGDQVTYTARETNFGPGVSVGSNLAVFLPAGLKVLSVQPGLNDPIAGPKDPFVCTTAALTAASQYPQAASFQTDFGMTTDPVGGTLVSCTTDNIGLAKDVVSAPLYKSVTITAAVEKAGMLTAQASAGERNPDPQVASNNFAWATLHAS